MNEIYGWIMSKKKQLNNNQTNGKHPCVYIAY